MNFFLMKSFTLTVLLTALLAPTPVLAGYKALLKSGEELYVSNYWVDMVDKDVIRLLVNGTMTRISRSEVLYIAPTSSIGPQTRTAIKRISFAPRPLDSNEFDIASAAPVEPKGTDPQEPPSALQLDAEQLNREIEMAKEDYREILKNGELEGHQEARDRIRELSRELNELRERAKDTNQGELPAWWRW